MHGFPHSLSFLRKEKKKMKNFRFIVELSKVWMTCWDNRAFEGLFFCEIKFAWRTVLENWKIGNLVRNRQTSSRAGNSKQHHPEQVRCLKMNTVNGIFFGSYTLLCRVLDLSSLCRSRLNATAVLVDQKWSDTKARKGNHWQWVTKKNSSRSFIGLFMSF